MSTKIGRFEILSEIVRSEASSVYKASDPDSKQTVALKAIRLEPLGAQSTACVSRLLEEAESSKVLNSHNIALLYGAGEMESRLCASMEYVQGNSIATMLARKEGFSIWDLQDIARQTCQGLDHAHVRKVFHCSLEPAKIMVQWDGVVKLLSFGVSGMGLYAAQASGAPPEVLYYMSPEQLRGEPVSARSNLFSLGAILYEMVTERKAFEGQDADQVRLAILESTPLPINQVKQKIHPALIAVIEKALSKAPEERYQSGQELVTDLEKCKENAVKAAVGVKPAAAKPEPQSVSKPAVPAAKMTPAAPPPPVPAVPKDLPAEPAAAAQAAAAGAQWSSPDAASLAARGPRTPKLDPTAQFISNCVKATVEAASSGQANLSAVAEPPTRAPKITVDPMMDESRQPGVKGPSFSEVTELPPLKEVYLEPSPETPVMEEPPAPAAPAKAARFKEAPPQKPRVPAREAAKKAVHEITSTPPRLYGYAIAAAAVVILLIVGGIALHIRSEEADDDNIPVQSAPAETPAPAPSPAAEQPNPAPAVAAVPSASSTAASEQVAPQPPVEKVPDVSITPKYSKSGSRRKAKTPPPAAPAIIPGQLSLDSTPQGAQIQVDGQSAGFITPHTLAGLTPGQHTIAISKPGFAVQTRSIDVTSGSRSIISIQLVPLTASLSANSTPAGAAIWIDGKDTGHVTPAQIIVDKPGSHNFVFKKDGYLDETASANLQIGQTFHLAPELRALGNTDEIRTGGRFKKLFGGADTEGMGGVSIKTQPKGAQIAVNNRIIDKLSPVEFYLNPGNYVIDITRSGFKSVHKVITVEKNGKVAIEESLDRE